MCCPSASVSPPVSSESFTGALGSSIRLYGLSSRIRCTCASPGAVFQFLTSSLASKSDAFAAGITWSLVGAVILTTGVGAGGSGLAGPSAIVTGGAGGAGGVVGAALAELAEGGADTMGIGGGGGGGGGGRFSLPPPHAIAMAAGRNGTANSMTRRRRAPPKPDRSEGSLSFVIWVPRIVRAALERKVCDEASGLGR